jgi:hypothetical protein
LELGSGDGKDLFFHSAEKGLHQIVQVLEVLVERRSGIWPSSGRLNSAEVVVNWYLNNSVGLKFDYVQGFIENPTAGALQLGIFGTRFQLVY